MDKSRNPIWSEQCRLFCTTLNVHELVCPGIFLHISQYLVWENPSWYIPISALSFSKAVSFGKLRENFINRTLAAEGKRKLTSEVGWPDFLFCFVLSLWLMPLSIKIEFLRYYVDILQTLFSLPKLSGQRAETDCSLLQGSLRAFLMSQISVQKHTVKTALTSSWGGFKTKLF